tara:strand:- start:854 stop:1129 length:276 start_codon:yes stop_codon:yes gene_type:complete
MKFDDYNKMSDMEQLENEDEFIHQAFYNSYLLLTNKTNKEEFLDSDEGLLVAHNIIEDTIDQHEVDGIITYFAELDDYDKCIELRDRNQKK